MPKPAEAMVARVIHERDEKARRSHVEHVRLVVDCLNAGILLGEDDPIMSQVALAGGGLRKLWRHIGIDDLTAMLGVKTQHAADSATAANDFQRQTQVIIRHLLATDKVGSTIGDIIEAAATNPDGDEE